jgi:hypothetical protein
MGVLHSLKTLLYDAGIHKDGRGERLIRQLPDESRSPVAVDVQSR